MDPQTTEYRFCARPPAESADPTALVAAASAALTSAAVDRIVETMKVRGSAACASSSTSQSKRRPTPRPRKLLRCRDEYQKNATLIEVNYPNDESRAAGLVVVLCIKSNVPEDSRAHIMSDGTAHIALDREAAEGVIALIRKTLDAP